MGLGMISNNAMTDSMTIECGATNQSKSKEQIEIQNQMIHLIQCNPLDNRSVVLIKRAEYYSQDNPSIHRYNQSTESLIVRRAQSAQKDNEYQSRKRLRNINCKLNRAEKYNRAEMDNTIHADLKKEELISQYQGNNKNSFRSNELKIEVAI